MRFNAPMRRSNQPARLSSRLSVSNEISELPATPSWRDKVSKSIIESAAGVYGGASKLIKTAPHTIAGLIIGEQVEEPLQSTEKVAIRKSYVYKSNRFPGVQDADLLKFRCILNHKSKPETATPLSFSFFDDFYLVLYQLGAVKYIQERLDPGLLRKAVCLGVGSGCLPAAAIRFGIDADRVVEEVIAQTKKAAESLWGPLTRISTVIKPVLDKLIPSDKDRIFQDNLRISLTRLGDLSHVKKSDFKSKAEIIDTILASHANPFTSCNVAGTRYISGDYSKSSKVYDKHTFTISGKVNSANISPSTEFTASEELEPNNDEKVYRAMVERGYQDAAGWFEKRWDAYVLGFNMKRKYPKVNEVINSENPEAVTESSKNSHHMGILTDDTPLRRFVPMFY